MYIQVYFEFCVCTQFICIIHIYLHTHTQVDHLFVFFIIRKEMWNGYRVPDPPLLSERTRMCCTGCLIKEGLPSHGVLQFLPKAWLFVFLSLHYVNIGTQLCIVTFEKPGPQCQPIRPQHYLSVSNSQSTKGTPPL